MILHILTACSRPEYLPAWAAELADAARTASIDLRWHVAFDLQRRHVGGQALKNAMLDSIPESDPGWVWIGDDDNMLDPAMLGALAGYMGWQQTDAVVFAQRRGSQVAPPSTVVNRVDAAQIVVRRSFIGAHRLPETYNGDGEWIRSICARGNVVMDFRELTRYNARLPC